MDEIVVIVMRTSLTGMVSLGWEIEGQALQVRERESLKKSTGVGVWLMSKDEVFDGVEHSDGPEV